MAGRRTNLALLALLAASLGTGALALATGVRWGRWPVVAHGVAGLAVLGLAPWKSAIARRGLRRRAGSASASASVALGATVAVAIVSGVLHSAGWRRILPDLTWMQVHLAVGLLAAPLALWHVVARPVVPRRADLSRRALLRGGVLVAGAAVAYGGVEGALRLAGARGGGRRFTGSHEVGSGSPAAMPVTQWLDDDVQRLDPATWRLVVGGREWALEDLSAFDDEVTAVLDCTGGWWAEQRWEGARLDRLLPPGAQGRSLRVRSTSGYWRRFPIDDAPRLVVATRVAGEPLSRGHGFPARLVAPARRGFWWVKWVDRVDVSDAPWWLQPPFPLT